MDGAGGHLWRGVSTLLLTTTGRRTGEPYTTRDYLTGLLRAPISASSQRHGEVRHGQS